MFAWQVMCAALMMRAANDRPWRQQPEDAAAWPAEAHDRVRQGWRERALPALE